MYAKTVKLTKSKYVSHPFHLFCPFSLSISTAELQKNYYIYNNSKLIFIKSFSTSISLSKLDISREDHDMMSSGEESNINDSEEDYEGDYEEDIEEDIEEDFEEERDKFFSNDPSTSDTEELCDRFKDDEQGLDDYMEDKRSSVNEMAERIIQFHNRELERNDVSYEIHTELMQEVELRRSEREREINDTDEIIKETNFPYLYENENMEQESEGEYKGESDVNMSDDLSYNDNDDSNNKGGDGSSGSLGGSDGPVESSGTNNNLNRSVIDFVIEIESNTSIFNDWEFFDIM